MEKDKIYKRLAKMANSRLRCLVDSSKFPKEIENYENEIDNIMKNVLPHGSGIDDGCSFNYNKSQNNRLVINSAYHCMNENGYYDGWVDFTVVLTPDFELDYTLNIRGNFGKYGHVKDYLYQIFGDSFDQEVDICTS